MNRQVDVNNNPAGTGPAVTQRPSEPRPAHAIDQSRRRLLRAAGAAGMVVAASTLTGCRPVLSLSNPCRSGRLPNELADHPLVRAAWHGLDASMLWDCHVHLFGSGDSDAGVWINPSMYRWTSPLKVLQRRFYENAACAGHDRSTVDAQVVERLVELVDGMQVAAAAATAGRPKAMPRMVEG